MSPKILSVTVAAVVVIACAVGPAVATRGVDVSAPTYENAWSCLKSSGYDYGIVRAYQSLGQPDPNAPHTVYNAWLGGASAVDIYVFPCFSCGNPGGQIDSTIDYLAKYNISNSPGGTGPNTYGRMWLDIEGPQYWGGQSANIQFIQGLISQAQSRGISLGVYTSLSQWQPITGNWNGASSLPLWYANYDGQESFADFSPFAGWSSPSMKQYQGNVNSCGAGVDLNWYP